MSRRSVGIAMVILGGAMILGGTVLAANGSTEAAAAPPTTTTMATPEPAPSTTSSPVTTEAATTSTTRAATTTAAAATTSAAPAETVEEFVARYAAALATGDSEFVLSRLHPEVVEQLTTDACRAWVDAEIMALSDYEMTGGPSGPQNREFSLAGNPVTIDNVFRAPVRFMFGGQSFDATADFALLDGEMYWLGTC